MSGSSADSPQASMDVRSTHSFVLRMRLQNDQCGRATKKHVSDGVCILSFVWARKSYVQDPGACLPLKPDGLSGSGSQWTLNHSERRRRGAACAAAAARLQRPSNPESSLSCISRETRLVADFQHALADPEMTGISRESHLAPGSDSFCGSQARRVPDDAAYGAIRFTSTSERWRECAASYSHLFPP